MKNRIGISLNYLQFFTSLTLVLIILLHDETNPSFSTAKNIDGYAKLSLLMYNISEFFSITFGKSSLILVISMTINSILKFVRQKEFNIAILLLIVIFTSSLLAENTNSLQGGITGASLVKMIEKFTSHVHLFNLSSITFLLVGLIFSETYKRNKKFKKLLKTLNKKLIERYTSLLEKFIVTTRSIISKDKSNQKYISDEQSSREKNNKDNTFNEKIYFYKSDYQPKSNNFSDERGGFRFYRKPKPKIESINSQRVFANDLNQKLYEEIFERKKNNYDNSIIKNNFHVRIQNNRITLETENSDDIHYNQTIDNEKEFIDYQERDDLLHGLKENFYKIQTKHCTNKISNNENPHVNRVIFREEEKINLSNEEQSKKNEENHKENLVFFKVPEVIKIDDMKSQTMTSEINESIIETQRNFDIKQKNSIITDNSQLNVEQVNQTEVLSKPNFSNQTSNYSKNNFTKTNDIISTHKIFVPTVDKKNNKPFRLPELNFLSNSGGKKIIANHHHAQLIAEKLIKILKDFSVFGKITNYHIGPVITLYEFEPLPGTKSSRVIGLCDDIARSLSATSARISVIPGKNALGIELPNEKREIVLLKDILESEMYKSNNCQLPIALGKNILGEAVIVDLAKMPHLLVAGTTGSGKSVAVNTMIMSILYSLGPEECKFIMIDPKMLELSTYNGIPHLLTPVVTDPKKSVIVLKWVVKEMEERYRMMSYLGVRNIKNYNEKIEEAIEEDFELKKTINLGFDKNGIESITETISIERKKYPYIVVIVDEMADLMLVAGKEIEFYIQRLAQMARAAGIHIVMATQRPSVDVITGVIKANLPTRISFAVTSKIDSRTILGEQGAEQLLGMGDMLYMASGNKITRVHGPFVSDLEVERVVNYLQSFGPPNYLDNITNQIKDDSEDSEDNTASDDSIDQDFQRAVELVIKEKKISISYIQRQLRIGYNKSANIVDRMEREGIVTSPNHQGKRELIS